MEKLIKCFFFTKSGLRVECELKQSTIKQIKKDCSITVNKIKGVK